MIMRYGELESGTVGSIGNRHLVLAMAERAVAVGRGPENTNYSEIRSTANSESR